MKSKINIDSLDDILLSSNKPNISNNNNIDICLKKYKNNFENKKNLIMINNKYKYSRNIRFPRLKKSLTLKNILYTNKNNEKAQLINSIQNINKKKKKINDKRLSYSVNSIFTYINKINENENINKNKNKNNLILNNINKNPNYKNKIKGKIINKKEKLNYLFKTINSGKNINNDFINEYKRYFIKKKKYV